jgi:hypothetical protein
MKDFYFTTCALSDFDPLDSFGFSSTLFYDDDLSDEELIAGLAFVFDSSSFILCDLTGSLFTGF